MSGTSDVIVALATPRAAAAVFVIRLSGPGVSSFLPGLVHRTDCVARHATLVYVYDDDGEVIDEGLLIFFPGPASYTGEDVVEFSGHGSPVVMSAVLARCLSLGARLAMPGEFTQRAFLNGKMDLTQAEAVADLIQASSLRQAKAALRSLSGAFRERVEWFRAEILSLRVLVEASIDFVEEHLSLSADEDLRARLSLLVSHLLGFYQRLVAAADMKEGLSIVLVGPPNVGKSSLLNAFAQDDVAIVTELPGTTRDVIRVDLSYQGLRFHVSDTAGFRDQSADLVEEMGWSRAQRVIKTADIVCWVMDATTVNQTGVAVVMAALLPIDIPSDAEKIIVLNKVDLLSQAWDGEADCPVFLVSAKTGEGLSALLDYWYVFFQQRIGDAHDDVIVARTRHLQALDQALSALREAEDSACTWEMMAESLRVAQTCCDDILGIERSDELLGRIFSEFCVGK